MNKANEAVGRYGRLESDKASASIALDKAQLPVLLIDDFRVAGVKVDGSIFVNLSNHPQARFKRLVVWGLEHVYESGDTITLPFPINFRVEGESVEAPKADEPAPAGSVRITEVANICYSAFAAKAETYIGNWDGLSHKGRAKWLREVEELLRGTETDASSLTRAIVKSETESA